MNIFDILVAPEPPIVDTFASLTKKEKIDLAMQVVVLSVKVQVVSRVLADSLAAEVAESEMLANFSPSVAH